MGLIANLTLVGLVVVLGLWWLRTRQWSDPREAVRPASGRRRRSPRAQRRSDLAEDALKHIFTQTQAGRCATLESLSGALQVRSIVVTEITQWLDSEELVQCGPDGVDLTEDGRRHALQVIRTHRLWEQYLAEETGIQEGDWHAAADQMEHRLTPEQADELSQRIGNPAFDPHGDPIPTADGQIVAPQGVVLSSIDAPGTVRVLHIEDEPETLYQQLLPLRLQPGTVVQVKRTDAAGMQIDAGQGTRRVSWLAAGNVTVQLMSRAHRSDVADLRMSDLQVGQAATVAAMDPACRGVERRRLLDLGLVPGTKVIPELVSPGGDPVAYRIRGALIALRSQQARLIHVRLPDSAGTPAANAASHASPQKGGGS